MTEYTLNKLRELRFPGCLNGSKTDCLCYYDVWKELPATIKMKNETAFLTLTKNPVTSRCYISYDTDYRSYYLISDEYPEEAAALLWIKLKKENLI